MAKSSNDETKRIIDMQTEQILRAKKKTNKYLIAKLTMAEKELHNPGLSRKSATCGSHQCNDRSKVDSKE